MSSNPQHAKRDSWLVDQLTKSEFFYQKLHEYGLLEIAYAIEEIQGENLEWDFDELGISTKAWDKVIHRGIKPVRVFAHPYTLINTARSVGYYRGLAMVSLKSMGNIGLNINLFEAGTNKQPLSEEKAREIAHRLNELISRLIEEVTEIDPREFDLWRGMTAGSSAQGSWQNRKGNIAEELIKGIVQRRVREKRLLVSGGDDEITQLLTDRRTIKYGSEPDIAIYSQEQEIQAAVEIKGGIDPAGVLERVGAAIKSLSRAKQESPNSVTVMMMYQVSMSPQAERDLEAHRNDIDYWFTIEDVLNREEIREEIFRILNI